MSGARSRPALLVLAVLLFVASAAGGAEGPTSDPDVSPTSVPVSWIRPEEVASRADSLARILENAAPDAAARGTVERIERELSRLVVALEPLLVQARTAVTRSTTVVELEDLERELAAADEALGRWEAALTAEGKRVAEGLEEMGRARAQWLETRGHPETLAAGEAVGRRVEGSLAVLDQGIVALQPWRVQVLALNDHVVDRRTAVAMARKRTREATATTWTTMLTPGRSPLWSLDVRAGLADELPRVPAQLRAYGGSTLAYVARDPRPLVFQLVAAGLLMVAFGRFAAAHAASLPSPRPYALAALLVALATPWFHPLSPQRFRQLLGIVALVPAARLVASSSGASGLSVLVGIGALLVVDRFSLAVAPLTTVARMSTAATTLMGMVLAGLVLRRLGTAGGPRWPRLLARAALVGLGLALAAEIGGWDHLSAMLGRGIVAAGVVAVIIHAALVGLEPLVFALIGAPWLQRRQLFGDETTALARRVGYVLRAVGVALWLVFVLRAVGLHWAAVAALQSVLGAGVSIGALSISVGTVLAFVVTLLTAMGLARLIVLVLETDVYPRARLPRGVPFVLSTLVRYSVYSVGFLLALAAAGIQIGQLSILLGGLGVGLGLGLQDLVKNFAAGLTLLLERHLQPGDAVQLPGQSVFGRVLAIGMRATVVRAWDGSEVVVPNADLVAGAITNWTLSDRLCRVEVAVGVAYGSDPERVLEILLGAARGVARVLESPPPVALFVGFGDSSLDFLVRAWSDEGFEHKLEVTSLLAIAVNRALGDAGIVIPFPQRDLHLASVSSEARAALAGQGEKP